MRQVTFTWALTISIILHACIYLRYEISRRDNIIAQKDHLLDLSDQKIELLNGWVNDYNNRIQELAGRRTYEDGLEEGFKNYQNASYVKGYHAATTHNNPFSSVVQSSED